MDGGRLRSMIGRLRRAAQPLSGGLTDADLLARWVALRDEAAFEALLWRHAAAVIGVCRRVLGDAQEAEDAAQAAFLTLARKARSVGRRQAVAAWLYTVAYRAALRARTRRPRAASVPPRDLNALPARAADDPAWRDLRPVLDEEVGRLPERFRAPFVLCHVQGRTNEEAARELGCPVGTVLSRLARARRRLRDRLTRRGVTLGAAALTAVLAAETAADAAHGVLLRAAVRAAVLAAAGQALTGLVSTEVIALTESMVRAMFLAKVKLAGAVVFGLVLLGGGGMLSYRTAAGEPGRTPQDEVAQAAPRRTTTPPATEEDLKALLAQKDKEIHDLQERLRAMETAMQDKARALDLAAKQERDQAARAQAAEQEARNHAEMERDARIKAEIDAARAGTEARRGAGPALVSQGVIDQARDDVELLEAQLLVKRAQLDAVQTSLQATTEESKAGRAPLREVATLQGEARIKSAELRESEVRLAQAKRRLARLTNMAEPPREERRSQPAAKVTDLEKKLDALEKELESLRKELRQTGRGRQ
jgi:RNA polymerase sigma factor (sigma-70 family)